MNGNCESLNVAVATSTKNALGVSVRCVRLSK